MTEERRADSVWVVDDKPINGTPALPPLPFVPPELSEAEKLVRDLKAHEGKCQGNWLWKDGQMTTFVRCGSCGRTWEPQSQTKGRSQ